MKISSNDPADRGRDKAEKSTPDLGSKDLGRYKSVDNEPRDASVVQQKPEGGNRYQQQPPDASSRSEVDALKKEATRLDALAEDIDKKLKSPVDMDAVMADPTMRGMLRKQLGKEFSTENLDYLEAVERFNRNPSKDGFKEIYENYIGDDARSQVNLPNDMRKELDEKFQNLGQLSDSSVGKDFLETSRASITKLVGHDSLKRLKEDPAFKKYSDERIANLKEEKLAVVAQSDSFKSKLWNTHRNTMQRDGEKPLERQAPAQTPPPVNRYAPQQPPVPVDVLRDSRQQDDYNNDPDYAYNNVQPDSGEYVAYQNDPNYGYQNLSLEPGEKAERGAPLRRQYAVDPHTELVVDFERLSPLGERAVEVLKEMPELDGQLASDWASLKESLKNPETSLEEAQEKMNGMQERLVAVLQKEPEDKQLQRQQDALKDVTLEQGARLAQGGFGEVYQLTSSNGEPLVGKTPLGSARDKFLEEANREAMVYAKVGRHPNVARCYGMQNVKGVPTLVLENVQGGKLEDVFTDLENAYENGTVNQQEFVGSVQHLVKGSLQGLAQFEAMGMSHMDIKSDNIMFDNATMQAKLVDMGIAQQFGALSDPAKRVFVPNMPPEFIQNGGRDRVNNATDSYGIGRMLFPLMERDPDFQKHFQFQPGGGTETARFGQGAYVEENFAIGNLRTNANAASRTAPDGTPEWQALKPMGDGEKWEPGTYGARTAYVDFMTRLTHPDPAMRLPPSEALKHPFMTDNLGGEDQIKNVIEKIAKDKARDANEPVVSAYSAYQFAPSRNE